MTTETLSGDVVRWRTEPKPDTQWHIVIVADDDGVEHTVTGCALPRVGARVELAGQWEDSPRYGPQFYARSVVRTQPPLSADGVARWLRERVPGCGAKRAGALLAFFGGDAAKLWAALGDERGLGAWDWSKCDVPPDVIRAAHEALADEGVGASYQAMLHGWGMTQRQIAKVKKHWSLDEATRLLHANPYLLADHVDGFGFGRADAVATKLGIGLTDPARVNAAVLHYLDQAAGEGHVFGDQAVIHAIARAVRVSFGRVLDAIKALRQAERVIVEDQARVYLPDLHAAELGVARDLRERFAGYPRGASDATDIDVVVVDGAVAEETTVDADQARAIALLADVSRPIVFVTGGPGTGKTSVLRRALTVLDAAGATVHLAAPTGKAAKRMIEATGRRAHTLHSLLGYRPTTAIDCDVCRDDSSTFDYGRLAADDSAGRPRVVIVDESSMVDVRLWAALADATPGTCLRFVGDAHQLPPVGAGQPFRDALEVAPGDAVVRLRTVYRSKGEWVKQAAPAILAGTVPSLDPAPGFRFIEIDAADAVPDAVIGVFESRYDDAHFNAGAAFELGHMPVLVPQRTGSAGASRINNALHDLLNPCDPDEREIELEDKTRLRMGSWVMITKNDARKGVCNGDTGYISSIDAKGNVTVTVEGSDTAVDVPYTRGDARAQMRLAYASTVHKSQGSEYPWIVVVCHSAHRRMLTRRLLYTAVTRAREGVVLIGDRAGVEWAVGNAREVARCTWLQQRIGDHHGG